MVLFSNGLFISSIFFSFGLLILLFILHFPPDGVIATLFLLALSLFFFLLVPRGRSLAEQIRFRRFVAGHEPFSSTAEAWEEFRKQDSPTDILRAVWEAKISEAENKTSTQPIEDTSQPKEMESTKTT